MRGYSASALFKLRHYRIFRALIYMTHAECNFMKKWKGRRRLPPGFKNVCEKDYSEV